MSLPKNPNDNNIARAQELRVHAARVWKSEEVGRQAMAACKNTACFDTFVYAENQGRVCPAGIAHGAHVTLRQLV